MADPLPLFHVAFFLLLLPCVKGCRTNFNSMETGYLFLTCSCTKKEQWKEKDKAEFLRKQQSDFDTETVITSYKPRNLNLGKEAMKWEENQVNETQKAGAARKGGVRVDFCNNSYLLEFFVW